MRQQKIKIRINKDEKKWLKRFCKQGRAKAIEIKRAYILLALHRQQLTKGEIAQHYEVCRSAIIEVAKRYLEGGVEAALQDRPRSGRPIKYDEQVHSEVVALACSDAPEGREEWTLELLQEHMRQKEGCETISDETIRLILKDHQLKPWRKKNVVHRDNEPGVSNKDVSSTGALQQAI